MKSSDVIGGRVNRPRTEPPWPVTIPDGNWFAVYRHCLYSGEDGSFCTRKPVSRGNFYCGKHGGSKPLTLQRSKERYLMWCLMGEPFLSSKSFETFTTMFLKRLLDRIDKMPVMAQLKLLEIAVDLLNGGDGNVDQ
jgi:hypothetical protein